MLFKVTEDQVFSLVPPTIRKPSELPANAPLNKGGVSLDTFNRFQEHYNAYILAEIRKAGLEAPTYPTHPLLESAQAHMVAGAILRIYDNPQNPYKDLFATGNIFLRAYIDDQIMTQGTTSRNAPEFYKDEDNSDSVFNFLE